MNGTILKIKGFLGICQYEQCWNKSYVVMKVKRNSETLHMCKCHADELIAYNDLKNIYIK